MAEILQHFKSLADETRLRLVVVLRRHELNVNELVAVMDMGQSRISRHLKILSEAGLLTPRRDGLRVFYSAREDGPGAELLQALAPLLDREPAFDDDLARAARTIDQRKENTRHFFNSIAEHWGHLRQEVLGDFDIAGQVTDRMPDSAVAVDLGCGTGEMLPALLAKAEHVIGVDGSPRMLELARARFAGNGRRVSLRIGELEHLPLRDREADFAVASMALHHLARPQEGLAEAARVLKTGGRLVIAEFGQHDSEEMRSAYGDQWLGFSEDQMRAWLAAAGFKHQDTKRFPVNRGLSVNIITSINEI